jgi:hypothetical protein
MIKSVRNVIAGNRENATPLHFEGKCLPKQRRLFTRYHYIAGENPARSGLTQGAGKDKP